MCWPFNKTAIVPANRMRFFIIIALSVSVFGYCTELIQKYWVPGREYDLLDWAADSFGALIGFLYSVKRFNKLQAN